MLPHQQSALRRILVILVLSFVLIAAVYRKTPMNFLRAESGWFLVQANSDSESQQRFRKSFFLGSYGGHYTPLAFLAEFEMAKIAGTNESIWKWRQILALSLIAAALAGIVYAIGGVFQLPTSTRWLLALAVTAGSVYRPEMMDFIAWPFMIFQLIFLGLLVLALHSVLRFIASPDKRRWPWVAALAAYGSMHVSGLGLVAVVAVAVVFGGILLVAVRSPSSVYHAQRKNMARALITMLCLSAAHGSAMFYLLDAQKPFAVSAASFGKLLLGFTANLGMAALRAFVGTPISETNPRALAYSWPYGILLIAAGLLLLGWLLRKALNQATAENVTRFALHAFSISAFFAMIGLIAARSLQSSSLHGAANILALYTSVPRYILPLHFLMIASVVEVLVRLAQRAPRFSSGAFCALALAALATQLDYRWNTFPYVAPLARISHTSAWGLIVATARECRAAQMPIPDVPLGSLTQEFSDESLGSFQALLRHELQLKSGEKIEMIAWEEYLQAGRDRYHSVPSLQLLEHKLNLEGN
jgi:hypothetical protein